MKFQLLSAPALPPHACRWTDLILVAGLALAALGLEPSAAFAQTWTCGSGACTTTGSVGVNTPNPGASIDVSYGDIRTLAPNTGFVIQAPDFWSNGWARGLTFTNSSNALLAQFGAYGFNAPSTLNYAYVGASVSSPWIAFKPNGNVGINSTTPSQKLHINGAMFLDPGNYDGNWGSAIRIGWQAYPANVYSEIASTISIGGPTVNGLKFNIYPGGGITNTPVTVMTMLGTGRVGIGTSAPCTTNAPANCLLSVNGAVQAKEVVVNTGWSDYVFARDYHLAALSDVAKFIENNHHLPGIPSADEVLEYGVSLGEMQSKLLARIEELTLHAIEAEKRVDRLDHENRDLRKEVQEMHEMLAGVELGADGKGRVAR